MARIDEQIRNADAATYRNSGTLGDQRDPLSVNVPGQPRNVINGFMVRAHLGYGPMPVHPQRITTSLDIIRADAKLKEK